MLAFLHFHLMTRNCLGIGEKTVLRLHEFELLFFIEIEISFRCAGNECIPSFGFSRRLKGTNVMFFLRDPNAKIDKLLSKLFPLVYGNPFK